MTRTKQQLANMKSVKDAAPNCRKRKNPAQSERMRQRHERIRNLEAQVAAEKEVGHNQAVTLGQQIIKLEDQLATEREAAIAATQAAIELSESNHTLVDALKRLRYCRCNDVVNGKHNPDCNVAIIDAALAKVEDQPVQLPMINDDPVVTLK